MQGTHRREACVVAFYKRLESELPVDGWVTPTPVCRLVDVACCQFGVLKSRLTVHLCDSPGGSRYDGRMFEVETSRNGEEVMEVIPGTLLDGTISLSEKSPYILEFTTYPTVLGGSYTVGWAPRGLTWYYFVQHEYMYMRSTSPATWMAASSRPVGA